LIAYIKSAVTLPIVLFRVTLLKFQIKQMPFFYFIPISGRNPDYLIGHQVDAAPILKKQN
jgi:putative glycerol-1-phosphate prenyltransferase